MHQVIIAFDEYAFLALIVATKLVILDITQVLTISNIGDSLLKVINPFSYGAIVLIKMLYFDHVVPNSFMNSSETLAQCNSLLIV